MAEEKPEPEVKFYAAILQADGAFGVEEFAELAQLTTRLQELIDRDVSVFSFAGQQLKISKPPFRHLLTPWGAQPLFPPPTENLEPDETGYLGLDPIHLESPPELQAPAPQRAQHSSDDFFPDNDDDVLTAFSDVLPDPEN